MWRPKRRWLGDDTSGVAAPNGLDSADDGERHAELGDRTTPASTGRVSFACPCVALVSCAPFQERQLYLWQWTTQPLTSRLQPLQLHYPPSTDTPTQTTQNQRTKFFARDAKCTSPTQSHTLLPPHQSDEHEMREAGPSGQLHTEMSTGTRCGTQQPDHQAPGGAGGRPKALHRPHSATCELRHDRVRT